MATKTSQLDPEPKYGEPLDDDELLRYHWYLYDLSKSYFGGEQRKEHRRLQDMYFGKTLTAAEVDYLTGQGRVPINFNFFCGTVNALVGTEAADRKECVFKSDQEDPDLQSMVIADWMTILCRKQMVACDGPRILSDAFQDDLIVGSGFTEVYLDVSRMPMRVVLKPILETEVFPDPDAREHNYTDGQFIIKKRRFSLEEIQARWPDKAAAIEAAAGSGALPSIAPTENVDGVPQRGARPNRRSKIDVYHLEYWRPSPRKVWYDPQTGERRDTTPDELAQREKELAAQVDPATGAAPPPVQEFTYTGRSYWSAWIAGDEKTAKGGIVLEHQESTVPSFTTKVVTGFRYKDYDKERLQYFGIGLLIAYAQLYLDKALRMWLEIVDRGSKGGGDIEADAIPGDPQTFIKERSKPGIWQIVNSGTNTAEKIKEREQPRTPQGYEDILNLCRDAISGLSSVTDVVKGTAETERSNVLVTNLQGQSRTMWGPLFESYTSYVMDVGKLVVAISLKHLPDVELDRLIGPVQVEGMTHTKSTDPASGEDVWQPIMVPATSPGGGQPCQDCGGAGVQGMGMGGMMQGGMGAPAAGGGEPCPTCEGKGRVQPATPSYYLKQEDPFLYKVTVDVGQSSPTARNAFWQIFQQGIGKMLTDLGVEASDILPIMAQNMPLPGTQANELAKRIEATLAKKEQLQAPQGIAAALQGLGAQGAQQVIQQVAQALKLDLGGQEEEQGEQQKSPLKVTGKLELMTPDEQAQFLAQVGVQADQNPAAMPPPTDGGAPPGPPGAQG